MAVAPDPDVDLAAGGRVVDGVVDEHEQELDEAAPVCRCGGRPRRIDHEPDPAFGGERGGSADGVAGDGCDVQGPGAMVSEVASHPASCSRSPTRPPRRSASAITSSSRSRPSSATSRSRSSTSALARMRAAGVRSSCEASATKRRWASNPSRIGTSARPVTT